MVTTGEDRVLIIHTMKHNWINIIQNYLLPPTCSLCGNNGDRDWDLCHCCYTQLPRYDKKCIHCAEILEETTSDILYCGRCLSNPPAFDRTYAPFIYQGAVRYLIHALKFGASYKNARLLGQLLSDYLQQHAERPELIMPVPLHKHRYRERGFNQAIEIARTVATQLTIPLSLDHCVRHRDTAHQTGLDADHRQQNLKQAFSLVKPLPDVQHIALLDDVMTTGSTAHELAKVLKSSGIKRVDVWVCGRA